MDGHRKIILFSQVFPDLTIQGLISVLGDLFCLAGVLFFCVCEAVHWKKMHVSYWLNYLPHLLHRHLLNSVFASGPASCLLPHIFSQCFIPPFPLSIPLLQTFNSCSSETCGPFTSSPEGGNTSALVQACCSFTEDLQICEIFMKDPRRNPCWAGRTAAPPVLH